MELRNKKSPTNIDRGFVQKPPHTSHLSVLLYNNFGGKKYYKPWFSNLRFQFWKQHRQYGFAFLTVRFIGLWEFFWIIIHLYIFCFNKQICFIKIVNFRSSQSVQLCVLFHCKLNKQSVNSDFGGMNKIRFKV